VSPPADLEDFLLDYRLWGGICLSQGGICDCLQPVNPSSTGALMNKIMRHSLARRESRQKNRAKFILAGALLVGACVIGASSGRAQPPISETVFHSFTNSPDGMLPTAGLTLGIDGALYGATGFPSLGVYSGGDANGDGVLFTLNRDGNAYQVIYQFSSSGNPPDGTNYNPCGTLLQGRDGLLYGTTFLGGTNGGGTIYKIHRDGNTFQKLHDCLLSTGALPDAPLMQGTDGWLYGTMDYGGTNTGGTLFKLDTNGGSFAVLYNFAHGNVTTPPYFYHSGVYQGSDGFLYGTGLLEGSNAVGSVFKLDTNGNNFLDLHSFSNGVNDGHFPIGGIIQAGGTLYGVTLSGGAFTNGTIYQINPNGGGYQVLHSFTNAPDGAAPYSGLALGVDGALYGTTFSGGTYGLGTVYRINPNGSGYRVLHSFSGYPDGANPYGSLVQGPLQGGNGILFGTTSSGGTAPNRGTIFAVIVASASATLSVSTSGGQSTVLWPAWAVNYILQSTTNLASPNWQAVTNGTAVVGVQLNNTTNPPNAYYRLLQQY
jgi:uncharacterized repeat protein (TIGR03803 family)